MKRFLILIVIFMINITLLDAQTIKVVAFDTVKNFEPLFAKVLKNVGLSPVFEYVPQARLVQYITTDVADGAFFMTDQMIASMPSVTKIPVQLYQTDLVAVSIKPGVKVGSIKELSEYSVGYLRENASHLAATQGLANAQAVSNYESEFKMLVAGRFEVAIAARALVTGLAKGAGLTSWTVHEPPLFSSPLYFVLSQKSAKLETVLTPAFKKEVDSGQWKKDMEAELAKMNQ